MEECEGRSETGSETGEQILVKGENKIEDPQTLSRWKSIVVSTMIPSLPEKFTPRLPTELTGYPPGSIPLINSPRPPVLNNPVLPETMVWLVNALLLAIR